MNVWFREIIYNGYQFLIEMVREPATQDHPEIYYNKMSVYIGNSIFLYSLLDEHENEADMLVEFTEIGEEECHELLKEGNRLKNQMYN